MKLLIFFYVVPSSKETSFWPPSMDYISVIRYTYYTLQIMLDLLCGQLLLKRTPPVVFELLRKYFWCRAGFEPTKIEREFCYQSTALPPSQSKKSLTLQEWSFVRVKMTQERERERGEGGGGKLKVTAKNGWVRGPFSSSKILSFQFIKRKSHTLRNSISIWVKNC